MLQPKKTKYRKQMKGRNNGFASAGSSVSFGDFGLKATSHGMLTSRQIEAAASICLDVSIPCEVAFNPKSPKETDEPADAKPLFLPFICFLYFVFLGCSTFISSVNPNFYT